jgi:hypothetical protein
MCKHAKIFSFFVSLFYKLSFHSLKTFFVKNLRHEQIIVVSVVIRRVTIINCSLSLVHISSHWNSSGVIIHMELSLPMMAGLLLDPLIKNVTEGLLYVIIRMY